MWQLRTVGSLSMNLRQLIVDELNVEILDGNQVALKDLEMYVLHLYREGRCYHVDHVYTEVHEKAVVVDLFEGERA